MLNNLIAALNDCVWAFDVNAQKYVFISPSILTVTGYHVKDFQQNTELWEEIIDPRDYDGVITAGNKSDTEEWVELTYRIISKGGKTKWIHQKKRHFTDEQTNHQILLSVVEDVSDQKPINFNLQESLGDFSILFNNNPTPMWIYELPTLRIMKVNNAALMHYGYSENEFLSMTIRDIRPRFDLAKFNDYLYQKAIPESSLHGFNSAGVWKHQNKKGEIVYAEITGHEIKYNNHSCRIIIAADVTEKVLQQEDLKRREQFLTSLIDSQTNFLVRIDANCLFTFANKWFFKTLGYKKTDIIGKHFSVTALPEEKELCEQAFKNCSKNPGKVISLKHRKLDIEGNIHWIKWEFIAIAGENGQVTELQGIGQDVTQNVEIEKEIVWTKNNLEALINNTEDLTWSIDREGRYVYMNSAYRKRITDTVGVIPKEGDDAYAHSGQTDHINDEWRSYYHRAFLGERYFTRHESPDPKTKEPSYFEVSFNPIYKATKDEIIGVGCFARNITDRLKTEEALIEQNERLKNIASLSSHELRRPVASMMGLLNILDRSNFSNPENEQIMDHLFTVTNEIDEVIRLIVNKTFIDTRFPL
jgi:PAS domain S-box-containing protein